MHRKDSNTWSPAGDQRPIPELQRYTVSLHICQSTEHAPENYWKPMVKKRVSSLSHHISQKFKGCIWKWSDANLNIWKHYLAMSPKSRINLPADDNRPSGNVNDCWWKTKIAKLLHMIHIWHMGVSLSTVSIIAIEINLPFCTMQHMYKNDPKQGHAGHAHPTQRSLCRAEKKTPQRLARSVSSFGSRTLQGSLRRT